MGKETIYNKRFKDLSPKTLKIFLVENRVGSATPDMDGINRNGAAFKLEGKHLDSWPKRQSTCPLRGAFENGQLGWMAAWRSWGGHAFVLLHIGVGRANKFLILEPVANLEEVPLGELYQYVLADGTDECVAFLEGITK